MELRDFQTDLKYSAEKNEDEVINQAYYKRFPHLEKIEAVTDLGLQKLGIDKKLFFHGGRVEFVDEKKRRKDYGDILLEEYSNFDKKIIGWISKEKYTDYITYIVWPTKKMYFLPYLLLQGAWVKYYKQWLDSYGRTFSHNKDKTTGREWKTSSIPVPPQILFNAMLEISEL